MPRGDGHAAIVTSPPIEVGNPVVVVDYDPVWVVQFRSLRGRVAGALRLLAAAVEHVGSTAVPGLAAKPIIDIDVLLAAPDLMPAAIARLAQIGYVHQGDLGIPGREAFKSPPGFPAHNLYVCPPHSLEFRRHLAFRNYLRNHTSEAREYGLLKRALAARFSEDRTAYTQGKTALIEELTRRALAEVGR